MQGTRDAQANQVEIRSEDWNSWNVWADGRINAALEQHQNFFTEVTGEALGEISAGLRQEFHGKSWTPRPASSALNCAS